MKEIIKFKTAIKRSRSTLRGIRNILLHSITQKKRSMSNNKRKVSIGISMAETTKACSKTIQNS